jgi:ferric-dicitrate binding protein FerR (iron transport regulator)
MRPQEFKSLLEKFSRGACTPQEEKLINDWYENIESQESSRESIPELSGLSPEYRQIIEDRIWSKVNPHPPAWKKQTVWYYAVAAAALIALGFFITPYFSETDIQTKPVAEAPAEAPAIEDSQERLVNNTGSPKRVRLNDGSTVTLQPKSQIAFNKKFDGPLREVYLSGEAFFNVSRDAKRPFRVYSDEVVTQVLGTSFTVKAYEGDKEVTVAVRTGKVSVYTKHHVQSSKENSPGKPIILAPNQQAVYNRNDDKVVKEVVENPAILLPQSNLFRMSFDEAPVTHIFDVLEENYGIDIVYDKETLSKCMLTTAMSDEGLFHRIEVICKAIKANYKVQDGVILIDSAGCE